MARLKLHGWTTNDVKDHWTNDPVDPRVLLVRDASVCAYSPISNPEFREAGARTALLLAGGYICLVTEDLATIEAMLEEEVHA